MKRLKDGSASVWFRWRARHGGKLVDFTAGSWPGDSLATIREAHAAGTSPEVQGRPQPLTPRGKLSKVKEARGPEAERVRIHGAEGVEVLALGWQRIELAKFKSGEQGNRAL
ncbi:hypothetical protein MASR1M50_01100 [Burkholderiales bacterium]